MFQNLDIVKVQSLFKPLSSASNDYSKCLEVLTDHTENRNNFMANFYKNYKERCVNLEELNNFLMSCGEKSIPLRSMKDEIQSKLITIISMFELEGNIISEYSKRIESTYTDLKYLIPSEDIFQTTILTMQLIEDKHSCSQLEIKRIPLFEDYQRLLNDTN